MIHREVATHHFATLILGCWHAKPFGLSLSFLGSLLVHRPILSRLCDVSTDTPILCDTRVRSDTTRSITMVRLNSSDTTQSAPIRPDEIKSTQVLLINSLSPPNCWSCLLLRRHRPATVFPTKFCRSSVCHVIAMQAPSEDRRL